MRRGRWSAIAWVLGAPLAAVGVCAGNVDGVRVASASTKASVGAVRVGEDGGAAEFSVSRPDRVLSVLSALDGASLLVHVRGGAEIRRDGRVSAIPAALTDMARFGALRESWRELANTLEFEEGEAFDRLLGRSAGLAMIGGDGAWIVMSEIDAQTGERVRARLRAVPKAVASGVPILSIESGRVHAALVESAGVPFLMLSSPAEAGLFSSVIDRAREAGEVDAGEVDTGGVGASSVGVSVRLIGWPEEGATLHAEARRSAGGWSVRATLDSLRARAMTATLPRIQAWRPATIVDDGAIAGVVGVLPRRQIEGMLGSVGSVRVRDDRLGLDAFGPLSAAILTFDEGLEVCAAVEIQRGSADRGDAIAQVVLGRLQRAQASVGAFEGLEPTAMRVVSLGGIEPLRRGKSLSAWTYRGGDAQGRSWMLGALMKAPEQEEDGVARAIARIDALAASLGRDGPCEARAYILSAWLRVGAIVALTGGLVPEGAIVEDRYSSGLAALLLALRGVDRLDVRVWNEGEQLVAEGEILWGS